MISARMALSVPLTVLRLEGAAMRQSSSAEYDDMIGDVTLWPASTASVCADSDDLARLCLLRLALNCALQQHLRRRTA